MVLALAGKVGRGGAAPGPGQQVVGVALLGGTGGVGGGAVGAVGWGAVGAAAGTGRLGWRWSGRCVWASTLTRRPLSSTMTRRRVARVASSRATGAGSSVPRAVSAGWLSSPSR